jgi:hypothetical protein
VINMQEIFEKTVNDLSDMIDDAIRHTDIVALLKDLKFRRTLAENHRLLAECEFKVFQNKTGYIDQSCEFAEDEIVRDIYEFTRIVETFDYVIDVIESGKFAKE